MRAVFLAICLAGATVPDLSGAELFDIAPFARRCCAADRNVLPLAFDYEEARHAGTAAERRPDVSFIYGLQWAEERDIREVRVQFHAGASSQEAVLEYWFRNWPYEPPHMPPIEDPVDDPWNGKWLKAPIRSDCRAGECRWNRKLASILQYISQPIPQLSPQPIPSDGEFDRAASRLRGLILILYKVDLRMTAHPTRNSWS